MSQERAPSNAEVIAELRMFTIALALADFDLNALVQMMNQAPESQQSEPCGDQ